MYSAILAQSFAGGALGSDRFMQAMLTGNKKDKTDVYSIVANSVGLERNQAKGAVLGSLYGMGQKGFIKALLSSIDNPHEKARVKPIAKEAFYSMKGKKGASGLLEGGIASNFFNYSSINCKKDRPLVGPFQQYYPKTLSPQYMSKIRSTASLNYAVQAGCALTGLLSGFLSAAEGQFAAEGLAKEDCRYSSSIHDAVIYIVKKDKVKQASKAIVRAYIQCWALAFTAFKLGAIPQKIAYDIIIDVSHCIRKDAFTPIKTPAYEYTTPGYQIFVSPETGKLHRRDSAEDYKGYLF